MLNKLEKLFYGLGALSLALLILSWINLTILDSRINSKKIQGFEIQAYALPIRGETQFDLALAYLEQGNLPRTIEFVRKAEKIDGSYKQQLIKYYSKKTQENPSIHNQLGYGLAFYFNDLKPIGIQKIRQLAGKSWLADVFGAISEYESGNLPSAKRILQKVQRDDANHLIVGLLLAISNSSEKPLVAIQKIFGIFFQQPALLVMLIDARVLWSILILALSLFFYRHHKNISQFKAPLIVIICSLGGVLILSTWPALIHGAWDGTLSRWPFLASNHGILWFPHWDEYMRTPVVNWYVDFATYHLMAWPFLQHLCLILIHAANLVLSFFVFKKVFGRQSLVLLFLLTFSVYFGISESLINFGGHRDPVLVMFFLISLSFVVLRFKPWLSVLFYFLATMSSEGSMALALTLGYFHAHHKKELGFKGIGKYTFIYWLPYLIFLVFKKILFHFNATTAQTNLFVSVSEIIPNLLKVVSPFYHQEFATIPSNPWPVILGLGILFYVFLEVLKDRPFSKSEANAMPEKLLILIVPALLLYGTQDVHGRLAYLPAFLTLLLLASLLYFSLKGIQSSLSNLKSKTLVLSSIFFVCAWLWVIGQSTFQENQKHYVANFKQAQVLHQLLQQNKHQFRVGDQVFLSNLNRFDHGVVDFHGVPTSAAYPLGINIWANTNLHDYGKDGVFDFNHFLYLPENKLAEIKIIKIDWESQKLIFLPRYEFLYRGHQYLLDSQNHRILSKLPISERNLF
jgi:hypothetical protein